MDDFEEGRKYHVIYRWRGGRRDLDFIGIYRGVNESPLQGFSLHTFDIGGGAMFYLGPQRIKEAELL